MPKHRMSAEDRLDIFDLFARYAWSYDTGDAKGMAALFTEDGVMEGMDGRRVEGRAAIAGFCQEFIGGPEFRGTQHFNDHLRIDGEGGQCAVRSYWMSVRWDDSDRRYIRTWGTITAAGEARRHLVLRRARHPLLGRRQGAVGRRRAALRSALSPPSRPSRIASSARR